MPLPQCRIRTVLCLFVANPVCQWAGEWGWKQGWGCGQRKVTHGLWLIVCPWSEINRGCNLSPLGCGMGHTRPGGLEG